MKANTKEILRWIAIAVFGGFTGWISITRLYYIVTHFDGHWLGLIFGFSFLVFFTAPFYIIAYICFRRRYRELYSVLGVVGAFVVFGVLMSLPGHFHLFEYFDRLVQEIPWLFVLGFPVSLVCLAGPFYAAAWVFRVFRRLAQHPIKQQEV